MNIPACHIELTASWPHGITTVNQGDSIMKRLLVLLAVATLAVAQTGTIGTGTSITVRTNEAIGTQTSNGRVFSGVVNQDVVDGNGNVAIPRGSNAELIVRQISSRDLTLDLESVTVNGQRYALVAADRHLSGGRKDSVGKNTRTARYMGGGAALGAIIGAIAGGGRGAAIGAGAGAGAGAGTQLLTRGKSVRIPAESLVTFRLEQPLGMSEANHGYTRNGRHYHTRQQ